MLCIKISCSGSTTAYACMPGGTAQEIVFIDQIKEKSRGEAMDLSHGASFVKPVHIYAGEYADCHGADIIVITAGASQAPGQSRLDLVHTNRRIMEGVVAAISPYIREAILLIRDKRSLSPPALCTRSQRRKRNHPHHPDRRRKGAVYLLRD